MGEYNIHHRINDYYQYGNKFLMQKSLKFVIRYLYITVIR